MNKLKTLAHNLRSTEAAEIAEAALVLPLVLMFLLGIVWFGRAFNIYCTIQQAAQQGALAAARPTCATTCGNAFASGPSYTAVINAVNSVMNASHVDPGQITANPVAGCSTASNITICQQVELNSTTTPLTTCPSLTQPTPTPSQVCGVLVTFQYRYKSFFPGTSLNLTQITLTAQAQSRMEN
jgi:Flp pilus assembly protein TadG